MKLILAVAAAALLGLAAADCPNACSGNGVCNNYRDFCECYDNYQGNDCSQRTCQFGLAWADIPQGDLDHDNNLDSGFGDFNVAAANDPAGHVTNSALNPMWRPKGWWERHPSQLYGTDADYLGNGDSDDLPLTVKQQEGHFYAECSSRGLCDRETGICQCFTGFEGAACNRTACPNDCSGHGTCDNLRTVAPSNTDYRLWDADKNYGCVCDAEYDGADCSLRRCYKNDDPLTVKTSTRGYTEELAEQNEVQRVQIKCANGGGISQTSTVSLYYTDVQFGEVYETSSMSLVGGSSGDDATYATTLLNGLRALPNDVLASTDGYDKVTAVSRVTMKDEHNNNYYYYFVTFDHSLGNVPLMTVNTEHVVCRGGWEIKSQSASVIGMPYFSYYSDGDDATETLAEKGVPMDLTLTIKALEDDADPEITHFVQLADGAGAALAADTKTVSDYAGGDDWVDPAIVDLLPMYMEFPEGSNPDDSLDFYGSINDVYVVDFKAPAADCTVITPNIDTADTLPVQYMVASATTAELLYIEYTDPFDTPTGSQQITLAATYNAGGDDTLAGNDGAAISSFTAFNGWQRLRDTTTGAHGEKVKVSTQFGLGDQTGNYLTARGADSGDWTFNAVPGTIYGTVSAAPTLALENIGSTRAYDRVDIKLAGHADGHAGSSVGDYYKLWLNDVILGTFQYTDLTCASGCETNPAGWPTADTSGDTDPDQEFFGDTSYGRPTDLTTFAFTWGDGTINQAARQGKYWHFSLVRLPYQRSWGYLETFRAWFFSNTVPGTTAALSEANGRWINPHALTDGKQTGNIGVVLNWEDVSPAIDTYRWKLNGDERWITGQSLNRGEATTVGTLTDSFQFGRTDALNPAHTYLDNYAFQLGGGVDDANRACDDSTNAYLYLQLGLEGINDFPECSDRGLCNRETGECECFKGYKGTDCSLQSALAF